MSRLLGCALLAGVLAGACMYLMQWQYIAPLLRSAEQWQHATDNSHSHHDQTHQARSHAAPSSQGASSTGRLLGAAGQLLLHIAVGVGWALMLMALMELQGGHYSPGRGLLWGASAFLVCFALPALGMTPSMPGVESAALGGRQFWWLLQVLSGGAGLYLLVFGRGIGRLVGVALALLPLLLAPNPPATAAQLPTEQADLRLDFLYLLWSANLLFWLVLGGALGTLGARGQLRGKA